MLHRLFDLSFNQSIIFKLKVARNSEPPQTVDKVHFMDDVYSLFFYNRFMKTNARSDSYDV